MASPDHVPRHLLESVTFSVAALYVSREWYARPKRLWGPPAPRPSVLPNTMKPRLGGRSLMTLVLHASAASLCIPRPYFPPKPAGIRRWA